MKNNVQWRLALDLGVNSIGWCVLGLGPDGRVNDVLDMGTRVLTTGQAAGRDDKKNKSLAVGRREARGMRRRRDRQILRKKDLIKEMIVRGLMPSVEADRKKLELLDPYKLRAQALNEEIHLHHLGRAIFHLHQRRGFKSNRKSDFDSEDESGAIKTGIQNLKEQMADAGHRTVGEYLASMHASKRSVRMRNVGAVHKMAFNFYVERALVEEEFEQIWDAQIQFRADSGEEIPEALSEASREKLRKIIFRQRPLKKPEIGRCSLYPEDERAPKALLVAQKFRILKELANLKYRVPGSAMRPITVQQRDILFERLWTSSSVTFDAMRKKHLGIPDAVFNLESTKRSDLKGNEVDNRLRSNKGMGKEWLKIGESEREKIVALLDGAQVPEVLISELCERYDLSEEAAQKLTSSRLPQGHMGFSERALRELCDVMMSHTEDFIDVETGEILSVPIKEHEAVKMLGHHHSDRRPNALVKKLPYYGEVLRDSVVGTGNPQDDYQKKVGRISNPTVHIALNQLRRVVNALVDEYGAPEQAVIELARELKLNSKQKAELESRQVAEQKRNEAFRGKLEEYGQADTPDNMMRMRLYDEMPPEEKCCVYSGKPIGLKQLFSSEIEVDHILPRARTWDDGFGNKVICFREYNRQKKDRSPSEAFDAEELRTIQERADRLFIKSKANRFSVDAMDRYKDDGAEQLPRNLIDTQYMARVARQYLAHLCADENVWTTNGRLTSMLRGKWGLNSLLGHEGIKNRNDHRHHAIDAFVIGMTDRATINAISKAAGRSQQDGVERFLSNMPEPFPNFRERLRSRVDDIIVSYRPDHSPEGQLHEGTAYGLATEAEQEEGWTVCKRVLVEELKSNNLPGIRDKRLRKIALEALGTGGLAKAKAVLEAGGARRVYVLEKKSLDNFVMVRHGQNDEHVKLYVSESYHSVDIYEGDKGKDFGVANTTFDANRPPSDNDDIPGVKVITLRKGDLVEFSDGDKRRIMRLCKINNAQSRLFFADPNEGGSLDKRSGDKKDGFKYSIVAYSTLRKKGGAVLTISPIGEITFRTK